MDIAQVKKELLGKVPKDELELMTYAKRLRRDWERGLPALSNVIEGLTGERLKEEEVRDFAREFWEYVFIRRAKERILLENPYTDSRFIVVGSRLIAKGNEEVRKKVRTFMSTYGWDKVYVIEAVKKVIEKSRDVGSSVFEYGIYSFKDGEFVEERPFPESSESLSHPLYWMVGYAERQDMNSVLDIWLAEEPDITKKRKLYVMEELNLYIKDRDRNVEFTDIYNSHRIRVFLFHYGPALVMVDIDRLLDYLYKGKEQVACYLEHLSKALHDIIKEEPLGTQRLIFNVPFEGGIEFEEKEKLADSVIEKVASYVKASSLSPQEYLIASSLENMRPIIL